MDNNPEITKIKAKLKAKRDPKVIPFYSHTRGLYRCFSQFYSCQFTIDGLTFNCAEQWMMYSKAMLFKDNNIAKEILKTSDPSQIKALGRKVRGYDEAQWGKHRFDIVVTGNMAKFSQNPELMQVLMDTDNAILVEASPSDRIWGVGMGPTDPRVNDITQWNGLNLLGKALMSVREALGVHG